MSKIYKDYREFPMDQWRWPNFTPKEMACRGDDTLMIHEPSMDKLQKLRDVLGVPLHINSAYRSPSYNIQVGGAARSQHLLAQAFDVSMISHDPGQFEAAARYVGFTGFGFYTSQHFIHIDTGPQREWGQRWFDKVAIFKPTTTEPKPTPVSPVVGDTFITKLIDLILQIFTGKKK